MNYHINKQNQHNSPNNYVITSLTTSVPTQTPQYDTTLAAWFSPSFPTPPIKCFPNHVVDVLPYIWSPTAHPAIPLSTKKIALYTFSLRLFPVSLHPPPRPKLVAFSLPHIVTVALRTSVRSFIENWCQHTIHS